MEIQIRIKTNADILNLPLFPITLAQSNNNKNIIGNKRIICNEESCIVSIYIIIAFKTTSGFIF